MNSQQPRLERIVYYAFPLKHFCVSGLMSTRSPGMRLRDVAREHSPTMAAPDWASPAALVWGDSVKRLQLNEMNDVELVENFRRWVLEQDASFADVRKNNRIDDEELTPCFATLEARGEEAVRKLVSLTADANPILQLKAAAYAFDADPEICRRVLLELTKRRDPFALFAWAALARKDPRVAPSPGELLKNFEEDAGARPPSEC